MERLESMNSVDPEGAAFSPVPQEGGSRRRSSSAKLTDWQRFFLARLDYLLDVQRRNPPAEADQASLLSRAVYSTYLDCQTQGVGDEAQQRISATGTAEPSAN